MPDSCTQDELGQPVEETQQKARRLLPFSIDEHTPPWILHLHLSMETILHAPTANDLIVRRKAGPSPTDCLHPKVLVFKSVSKLTEVLLSDVSSTASHIFNQHQLLSYNHFLPWLLFSLVTQCKTELYIRSVCIKWYRWGGIYMGLGKKWYY